MGYNWACIGCGHIANEMAQAMQKIDKGFSAVYSRTKSKATDFANKYAVDKVYDSFDEVLCDDNIDIIYIATPHNSHIEFMEKALKKGKHILCEKAITLNTSELEIAMNLAEENNLILAEAMTIFHCPIYDKINEIIASGRLGKLKQIQVNLGSNKDYDMTNRFFNLDLAGGAMLDIGVYALSFARYFMTSAPNDVMSQMIKAPTGADEQVNILLKNTENEMATVTLALTSKLPKLGIAGFENGYVMVDNYNRTEKATIYYCDTETSEDIVLKSDINALGYEVIDMENAVAGRENKMHLDFTWDVMKIMTDVRYNHKMYYNEEK